MIALGTLLSASWILSANSWMQTPDGVAMQNGRLELSVRQIREPGYEAPTHCPLICLSCRLRASLL
jgi:hypothetical protein